MKLYPFEAKLPFRLFIAFSFGRRGNLIKGSRILFFPFIMARIHRHRSRSLVMQKQCLGNERAGYWVVRSISDPLETKRPPTVLIKALIYPAVSSNSWQTVAQGTGWIVMLSAGSLAIPASVQFADPETFLYVAAASQRRNISSCGKGQCSFDWV